MPLSSNPIFVQALGILHNTHDGDDLDPLHLKLVELAVNGLLSDAGKTAFAELVENVARGYVKPWLHGIEHVTRDLEGYIYWKNQKIEHYSFSGPNAIENEKVATVELARRCTILETAGIAPTYASAFSRWEEPAVDTVSAP